MEPIYRENWYEGTGKAGAEMRALAERGARQRGMIHKGTGKPNISQFLSHCVRFTMEHEK